MNLFSGRRWRAYRQPPREQIFYQQLALGMSLLGVGNSTWWGLAPVHWLITLYSHLFLVSAPLCLFLQFLFMYINYSDLSFRVLGTMFTIIPASVIIIVKLFISKIPSYIYIMRNLMDKIHIYNFWHDGDDFIKAKIIKVERYTRRITLTLVIFLALDWMLWVVVPIMKNIKNQELIANRTMRMENCIYMWMPFNYGYDFKPWMITHILNAYLIGSGVLVLAIYDSIIFIFIFHFMNHVDILKHKIQILFADELNDVEAKERIIRVIKYHSFIISTFKDMEAAFGLNVAINYAHNLLNDSLLLYQIMVGDKSNRLNYAIMMQFHMGGLILMSLAFEQIRMKSEDLPVVLYSIPWQKMSTSNQKMLIPILLRMQIPFVFKAAGGLLAGVRPVASIVKSTFSYYVMLRQSTLE